MASLIMTNAIRCVLPSPLFSSENSQVNASRCSCCHGCSVPSISDTRQSKSVSSDFRHGSFFMTSSFARLGDATKWEWSCQVTLFDFWLGDGWMKHTGLASRFNLFVQLFEQSSLQLQLQFKSDGGSNIGQPELIH